MKRIFIILILALTTSLSYAQDSETKEWETFKPKNTIYVAPFNAIAGEIKLSYEHIFPKNNAILVDFSGIYDAMNYGYDNNDALYGGEINVHYRNYVVYKNMKNDKKGRDSNLYGFYIDAFGGLQVLNSRYNSFTQYTTDNIYYGSLASETSMAGMAGFLVGNRFDFAKGKISLVFDGGFALKISENNYLSRDQGGIHRVGFRGIVPQGNFQFGFNF